MSKDFNEEKTFVDNYDLDFNFMETFQDEKKCIFMKIKKKK